MGGLIDRMNECTNHGCTDARRPTLKKDLVTAVYEKHLHTIGFFSKVASEPAEGAGGGAGDGGAVVSARQMASFVSDVAQRMESVAAAPGDLVVRQGEIGNGMFILLTGVVQVFSANAGPVGGTGGAAASAAGRRQQQQQKQFYKISAHDEAPFFGLVEMIIYITDLLDDDATKARTSVEALNFCDLAYIDKDDFVELIGDRDGMKEAFRQQAVASVQVARQKHHDDKLKLRQEEQQQLKRPRLDNSKPGNRSGTRAAGQVGGDSSGGSACGCGGSGEGEASCAGGGGNDDGGCGGGGDVVSGGGGGGGGGGDGEGSDLPRVVTSLTSSCGRSDC
jgi:CRP-like cAMP-binding protein